MLLINKREYRGKIIPYLYTNEEHTIPSSSDNGYYFIKLFEVPTKKPIAVADVVVTGYTETTNDIIGNTEFAVDYTNGRIYFNYINAGSLVSVTYYGVGCVVDADDVNSKIDNSYYSLLVKNDTASPILKGVAVKVSGYDVINDILLIEPITTDTDKIVGVVDDNIIAGNNGYILFYGNLLTVLDTSGASVNDPVYVTSSGVLSLTGTVQVGVVSSVSVSGSVLMQVNGSSGSSGGSSIGVTEQELLKVESQQLWSGK